MSYKSFSFRSLLAFLAALLISAGAWAQDPASGAGKDSAKPADQAAPAGQETDPLKRPLNEKQRKMNEKALYKELGESYKRWLDEDVRWIITDEEKEAFLRLSNNEERDAFIEQFWLRRDPTPDTEENEYKEEHYRRIAYANEHFAAGLPGWKTDRGRMYIMYGPPDQIDAHPSGGYYQRPNEEGGGTTSTYPFETWRYRYIEGIGQEVEIEFVDTCNCNDYHMTIDRSEKDALLHTPNGGLTQYESMGLANKADRWNNGFETLGKGPFNQHMNSNQFDRIEQFAKLQAPPPVKFKDLLAVVNSKITYNLMPFDVQADFVKVTSDTVLVPITISIKNRDITFVTKDGVASGVVNIFGRMTTLTGRIAQTFEDTVKVDIPVELLSQAQEHSSVYWKALPLRSNRYRLDVVLKDVNGDRMGTWSRGIIVPAFGDERLSASTLILAGDIQKVPTRNVGTGSFVIGGTKVVPRVVGSNGKPATFRRDERIGFWLQVYNLTVDQQTKHPSASVEYDIVNLGNNKQVVHAVESTDQMGNIGEQITLEKSLPMGSLEPGTYQITVKVDDKMAKQTISPTARFAVE